MATCYSVLCEGLALSLQQIVAGLGALQLALHQAQRLARRKDGFSRLMVMLVSCGIMQSYDIPRCQTYLQHERLFGGRGRSRLLEL